jgi:hypothetical protein
LASCIIPQACLEQIVPLTADFLAKMEAAIAAKVEERKRWYHDWYHHGGGKEEHTDRYHNRGRGKERQHGAYHSEEGVLLRKTKKQEAAAAILEANEGRATTLRLGGYPFVGNSEMAGV